MDITDIKYHTRLAVMPIPRDTVTTHLDLDTDKVMLIEDFVVSFCVDGVEHTIRVPAGYVTDSATIPQIFWRIYSPFYTEARWASCVHDFIYSDLYTIFTKEIADNLLRMMMIHDGASEFTACVFYRAVRLNFNGGGWK